MLIEKPSNTTGEIVSFRLVTGDEIIGKLLSVEDSAYVIGRPLGVVVQMAPNNQMQIGFSPIMVSTDELIDKVRYNRTGLVSDPVKPRKELADAYSKATSPILQAQQPGLVV